jgi:hypothetical protein
MLGIDDNATKQTFLVSRLNAWGYNSQSPHFLDNQLMLLFTLSMPRTPLGYGNAPRPVQRARCSM